MRPGQSDKSTWSILWKREQCHGSGDYVERALFELVSIKFRAYVQGESDEHMRDFFGPFCFYCGLVVYIWGAFLIKQLFHSRLLVGRGRL